MPDTSSANRKQHGIELFIGLAVLALAGAVFVLCFKSLDGDVPRWAQQLLGVGFLAAVAFGCVALDRRRRENGVVRPMRPPVRRYLWRFLPAMTVYAVVLFASMRLYRDYNLSPLMLWVVAIAPALPLLATIASIGLYLKEEDDEFQRKLAVSAYVLATGLMLAIATVWGFLEQFGLAPHVPAWSAFPLLALCLAPSQVIVSWRYR